MSVGPAFIHDLVATVAWVEQTARAEFGSLDRVAIEWQPGEHRWSTGQCLAHLVKSNTPYFEIFEGVRDGAKQPTFWERLPLLPAVWGGLVLNGVHPDTTRKARAPKIFAPSEEDPVQLDIVESFCRQQQELAAAMETLTEVDLDTCIVTSPVAPFVVYSLRSALAIVVAHEERHLRQAQNVLAEQKATAA